MSAKAAPLSFLVDGRALQRGGHLTLVRDATDACDAIPLLLNIVKTLTNKRTTSATQTPLFLSTRSRSRYTHPDDRHIHPVLSRAAAAATATCVALDPYTMQDPAFASGNLDFQRRLVERIRDMAREHSLQLVVIECMYSLKAVFGVDPSAFVRSLIAPGTNLSVISACPMGCGIDEDIAGLADISDSVCDLHDLQTGVANDIDGMLRVAKDAGRWQPSLKPQRYQVTEASFKIYT